LHNAREGTLKGCLSYISFGEGPPLVVFPGLFPSNANPTAFSLRFDMGWLSPLARAFTVHRLNRKVGLAPHTTMADLAPTTQQRSRIASKEPSISWASLPADP